MSPLSVGGSNGRHRRWYIIQLARSGEVAFPHSSPRCSGWCQGPRLPTKKMFGPAFWSWRMPRHKKSFQLSSIEGEEPDFTYAQRRFVQKPQRGCCTSPDCASFPSDSLYEGTGDLLAARSRDSSLHQSQKKTMKKQRRRK